MINKRPSRNLLLAAAIAAALPVPAALAQQGVTAIEEIVVTARKREESLQDVPISVTAISAAQLDEQAIPDIIAVAQQTPNVTLEVSRATNSTLTAFIRGIGQQDPVAGFEGGVGLYLDDIYLARPQGTVFEIYDVERIEVLRGPQGTLYGRNTIGGAVKYVTRGLSAEPELRLKAAVGSYSQTDVVVSGSMPLSDTFRIGGTIASFQRDGFGRNVYTGADNYDKDIMAARVSLEWRPTDDVMVRLAADYSDDQSSNKDGHRLIPGQFSGIPVLKNVFNGQGGIYTLPASNGGLKQQVQFGGVGLTIDWTINDNWSLKSVTAYREDESESLIDFDAGPIDDFDAPVVYENDQFSQEFQVNYNGERLSGVAGIYYLDSNAFDAFDVVLGTLAPPFGVTSFTLGDFGTKAWAAYANVSFDITSQFSASLGGRYTSDERTAAVDRTTWLGKGSPYFGNTTAVRIGGTPLFEGKRKDTDFSPSASLSFKASDAHNLYASYSQGFKGGSFDPRGVYVPGSEVRNGFKPETVDSYELGAKSRWADGRFTTNFAVFFADYTDVQVPGSVGIDTDGDGVNETFGGATTNAGKAEVKGLELEGVAQFTDAFSATFALGYIDAEYTKWLVVLNGVETDISGDRFFQNTPEWMGNLTLRYEWPLSMGSTGGALALIGSASYRDDTYQFEIPEPLVDQKAYTLFDASLVWTSDDGRYQLGLHGKNLSDKEYKVASYDFVNIDPVTGAVTPTLGREGTLTAFYGNPRTITGTFSVRF
jgi:iron complex outermembrane recepter protein